MIVAWWKEVSGPSLAQGDLLPDCLLPLFVSEPDLAATGVADQELRRATLIVVSQSCDLENQKLEFDALCPIPTLAEFELTNPEFGKKGVWENVRKGRVEGLHLLASRERPGDNREALVVDFGNIVSLPLAYSSQHAASLGQRFRLLSPFLEHFSQALAQFFMRVGLPAAIPRYEK